LSDGTAAWVAGVIAAALASAALIAWRTRRAERQNPAVGGMVDVDGVRLHYVDRGSGPAVVVLHGNGSMIEELAASGVLELAARRSRVIAFDRPGFGHSDRPRSRLWGPRAQARLLVRALRVLGVEQPIVLAHSWGTLVAL
jgi:pimeloyl-ACP methyl ester carboxylesterase